MVAFLSPSIVEYDGHRLCRRVGADGLARWSKIVAYRLSVVHGDVGCLSFWDPQAMWDWPL
jgi:hypothetical protein